LPPSFHIYFSFANRGTWGNSIDGDAPVFASPISPLVPGAAMPDS